MPVLHQFQKEGSITYPASRRDFVAATDQYGLHYCWRLDACRFGLEESKVPRSLRTKFTILCQTLKGCNSLMSAILVFGYDHYLTIAPW